MPISVANPLEDVDEDAFEEEGEGTEYNMRELMDQVYKTRDIIFTVPTDQIPVLKKGLITRKGKDNAKLKNNDITIASEVLSFLVYPAKDAKGMEILGTSSVRVKLGPKKSVTILNIEVPNDEF